MSYRHCAVDGANCSDESSSVLICISSDLLAGINGQLASQKRRGGPCVELGSFDIPIGSSINGLTHTYRDHDGTGSFTDYFSTGTDQKTPGPDPENMQFKATTISTQAEYDSTVISQTQYFLNNQPIGPFPKAGNYIYRFSYKHIPAFADLDDKLFYLDDINSCYATVRDFISTHLPRVSVYGLPKEEMA